MYILKASFFVNSSGVITKEWLVRIIHGNATITMTNFQMACHREVTNLLFSFTTLLCLLSECKN